MDRYQRSPYKMKFASVTLEIIAFTLFIGFHGVTPVTVVKGYDFQNDKLKVAESRYCDFPNSAKIYNITALLKCMDELASTAFVHMRNPRSSNDGDLSSGRSRRAQYPYPHNQQLQYNYPPRPEGNYQSYYERRPSLYYPGASAFQGDNSGYYDGGNRYPNRPETPFALLGGTGLFDALSSISQYDDLKCVPRLLCEVATGVIPGNSGYKQNYGDFGGSSLIRLLTALDIGGSSPLLTFGKSALTGYTSRGNPSVCYRDYPKCPRNNADLVNYLNNHNGGFFRFFANNRGHASQTSQGNYYRGALRRKPAPPPGLSGPEADRTGTGELKFDNSASLIKRDFAKSFFPEKAELNESNKVVFPEEPLQEEQSLNRVSKSLSGYQEAGSGYQYPFFFPQDRKDQEANTVYSFNMGAQAPQAQSPSHSSPMMESGKPRLYLLDDPTNETVSSFTFPDGQKVNVNVAFSKLFSDGYKKALRRSFANDHGPQPIDFQGFSMVDLAELFPNDRNRLDLQVVHPCDMICHDSKATPVQFNQILLHSNSLSTLMAPDQPILDLSGPLPCEVMCIDRRGERRRLSTTLNQVLKSGNNRSNQPNLMDLQDKPRNEEFRFLIDGQHRRYFRNRDVNPPMPKTGPFFLGKTANRPSRSTHKGQHQMPAKAQYDVHQFSSGHDRRSNGHRQPTMNDKSASTPEGSIMFGGGPMPFYGPSMPFMGMAGIPQGGPSFFPQEMPGPFAFGIPPLQSFGMMPMFPGMMPMMDPVSDGIGATMVPVTQPPTIVCSDPTCASQSQLPTRTLMMCGGVLYFIPREIFLPMPICAVGLNNNDWNSYVSQPTPPPTAHQTLPSSPVQTPPSSMRTTTGPKTSMRPISTGTTMTQTESYVTTAATTHKFRQPEGEDYPQVSCLEGESWNLDVHECVPIKYDKDIESDYTHLPGSPWSGVTRTPIRKHRHKKRKKLVIITDKGNITYIKAA